MKQWISSETIPEDWEQRCLKYNSLFHSPSWQHVLQLGFGNQTLYIWNETSNASLTATIFKTGPFRIAYVGFPVGGLVDGSAFQKAQIDDLKQACLQVHLLRFPTSSLTPAHLDLSCQCAPETAISDLAGWRIEGLSNIRRNVNKAQNSGLVIQDLSDAHDHTILYQLYKETVLSHGGSLRYTKAYFKALLYLSTNESRLRCIGAFKDGRIVGFLVSALHNTTGYYLHGASEPAFRCYRISDLLMYEAIRWAQNQNMACFNLMASPPGQPGLIRFKEKFGAETRIQSTYELVLNPLYANSFKMILNLQKKVKNSFRKFLVKA